MFVEVLVHGNATAAEAQHFYDHLQQR